MDHITSTLKTLINNSEPFIKKITSEDKVIVLSGNPNVGKSTVFNNLTGLNQHTGNWPGKTVTTAQGYCHFEGSIYTLVDIPGTYSLMTHSAEEEVARNLICFSDPDAIIVVCDATCLERNLNLVLQTLEITSKVVVCVNLMDESKRKNIRIDLNKISKKLNVPVIGTTARNKKDLIKLLQAVKHSLSKPMEKSSFKIEYLKPIEDAVTYLEPFIRKKVRGKINPRWLSLKLLDFDETLIAALNNYLGFELLSDAEIYRELGLAKHILLSNGISDIILRDSIVSSLVMTAERICADTIQFDNNDYNGRDRQIDKVLTNRWIGFPIMIILLMGIFWLTITGGIY